MRCLPMILIAIFWVMAGSAAAQEKAPSAVHIDKPGPEWRTEIIPFPLDFAPEIPLTGVEELAFAPGMFKPDQTDFFSYGFVFLLDQAELITDQDMKDYLHRYYAGLYTAVAKTNLSAETRVELTRNTEGAETFYQYSGQIHWTEPFVTQQPQVLNLVAIQKRCDNGTQVGFLALVSPQPLAHEIWSRLKTLTWKKGMCFSNHL